MFRLLFVVFHILRYNEDSLSKAMMDVLADMDIGEKLLRVNENTSNSIDLLENAEYFSSNFS
jgi:hypothetical protein